MTLDPQTRLRRIAAAIGPRPGRAGRRLGVLVLLLAAGGVLAGEVRKNWFNDPFFQVRSGDPACPVPLGPFITETERNHQAHGRIERGTTCWLTGHCAKPNAYLYDPAIGKAVAERFAASTAFADASLWITVQRRIVWVEGCVPSTTRAGEIEAFLRSVPDVDQVITNLRRDPKARPPYAVNEEASGPGAR